MCLLILLVLFTVLVYHNAFLFNKLKEKPYRVSSPSKSSLSSSFNDDINDYEVYEDFLDFNRPVEGTDLKEQYSLGPAALPDSGQSTKPIGSESLKSMTLTKVKRNPRKSLPYWDDFMEEYLGDMEDELNENDRWLGEIRDYVEQKRGRAIWSKKSDAEIQQELKKAMASRGIQIPTAVAQVITAVYIERTHKMKEYKEEDELACIEFRKWIREQKKKSKRDPIVAAKIELANVSY